MCLAALRTLLLSSRYVFFSVSECSWYRCCQSGCSGKENDNKRNQTNKRASNKELLIALGLFVVVFSPEASISASRGYTDR